MLTTDGFVSHTDEAPAANGRPRAGTGRPGTSAGAAGGGGLAGGRRQTEHRPTHLPLLWKDDAMSADAPDRAKSTGQPATPGGGATAGPGLTSLPRLYTVAQTAAYAQTSEKTVRRWLNSGVLPCHRLGRQIRIAEADLLAFIAARWQQ
jgi:excisionase family DNA binding protein